MNCSSTWLAGSDFADSGFFRHLTFVMRISVSPSYSENEIRGNIRPHPALSPARVYRARRARSAGLQSISICPNRRRPRESLLLVVVLVIVNRAVEDEDEKEDEDDLVAAPPCCAVSQVF